MIEEDRVWRENILAHYPNWETKTPEALALWEEEKKMLSIGQTVTGEVISVAHFGVWIKINKSFPTLLQVIYMARAKSTPLSISDYPQIGETVSGRLNAIGPEGESGITQLENLNE